MKRFTLVAAYVDYVGVGILNYGTVANLEQVVELWRNIWEALQ
jgi:hypothetical protein